MHFAIKRSTRGKDNSACVNVSNRVRKGAWILSSKLFTIYVDDLLHELALCRSG